MEMYLVGGQQRPDGQFQLFLRTFLGKPLSEEPLVRALVVAKSCKKLLLPVVNFNTHSESETNTRPPTVLT